MYESNNIFLDKMDLDRTDDKIVRNSALLVVALGSFLIPFMGSSLNIALPLIQSDLNVNIILLSWIPTVFVLASAAFLLTFGRLADIHGKKKIFSYGVVVYTVASLMAALSPSGMFLIIFSFLQGIGCSLMFATGVALLSSVYPSNQRGEALGIYITAVYSGLFLGPLLGGFLAQNLGWRSIFLFNVLFGLFLFSLITLKLKGEWKGSECEKFDFKGSALYTISIVLFMYGFSTLQSAFGWIIFLAGIFGLFLFIKEEKESQFPILRLEIFMRRSSSFSAMALLLMNIATTAMWALLSLYFQDLRTFGPQMAALILSVQPLMVALLSSPVGRMADHRDNRVFSASGMAVTTLGLVILSSIGQNTNLLVIILGLILVGVGLAVFSSPTTNIFMGSVGRKNYGMASATLSTMIYTGQTLSLGIMLFIFTSYLGNVQVTASNFATFILSLKTAFTVFAVIGGVGIVVSILMGNKAGKTRSND
jgi:MFS family permease